MSNNCLVTKLKGVVQNDNLPIYNTLVLDYAPLSVAQRQITIGANSVANGGGDVYVTFAVDVHNGGSSGVIIPANTKFTVLAGTRTPFFTLADQGSCSEFVKIENIYNLESLIASDGLILNKTVKNGVASLGSLSNLVQFGGIMTNDDNIKCKKIRVCGDKDDQYNFDNEGLQSLETLSYGIYLPSVLSAPNSVRMIKGRWNGDVKDWPFGLRVYNYESSLTTGDIAEFVTKCNSNQRTQGYIAISFSNPSAAGGIELNGVAIKDDPNHVVLSIPRAGISNWAAVVIKWNGSTISYVEDMEEFAALQTTLNDSIDKYLATSDYRWQPYV